MMHQLRKSFAELKQLVHLDLSHCRITIPEAFGRLTKLQYLNLSVQHNSDARPIRGLPEVIGNLVKLRYINLSRCMKVMAPSEDQINRLVGFISTLSNLEHMDLSENEGLTSIPGNLRKLHILDLSGCHKLKKLPDSMVNMVSLKVLKVETSITLDESVLSLLNIASLPHFVVHASSHKRSSNIILLQPTNPVTLTIDRLENVKSAEEARSIKLIEKQNNEKLTFKWTLASERFVDDKEVLKELMPPSSVQRLFITGYMSVSIPDWFMGITLYLPNISLIDLCDFPNCNNLPPLGQLPNLDALYLSRMEYLEEWNLVYASGENVSNELIFPKLKRLTIKHCTKLRIKPCLPARTTLFEIVDCDNALSSWGESLAHRGASSSSPITDMFVEDSMVPLHQWSLLHQLPALRSLSISNCSDLTITPEIIQRLSSLQILFLKDQTELPRWVAELASLQSLNLSECRSMTSLPQWLGELTSIQIIEIVHCMRISSLPGSIQQLTKLEHLIIRDSPTLVEWCESEENKTKLTHIGKFFPRSANEDKVDDLYSAVMNMRGFTEEDLSVAVSHLMDNQAQGSTYMGMHEEQRVSWLRNFLGKYHKF